MLRHVLRFVLFDGGQAVWSAHWGWGDEIMPLIIAIIAALLYFGYFPSWGFWQTHYAAEVGYYRGQTVAWDLWGDFTDLDECRSAAINRYNFYSGDNQRGYTWSCLEKDGKGGYTTRHR